MDPLTAVGLAAAVVQFLQFGGTLVTKSRQIYDEGSLVDHIECENATTRLLQLTTKVKDSVKDQDGSQEQDRAALQAISDNCLNLSQELLSLLQELRLETNHKSRRWKSFRQALKSVSSKEKIDDIENRVSKSRNELHTHVLVSLSEKADALARQEQQSAAVLSEAAETAIQTLLENRNVIRRALAEQTEQIFRSNLQQHAENHLFLLSTSERKAKKQMVNQIVGSLTFPAMRDRYDEIPEAHRKTFRWILENSPKNNFVKWLQSGAGLYWINGKAGSGKSTLMRFISDNPKTKQYLATWAGQAKLDVASFYFWNGGSLEQRSQNLVPSVFPDEWVELDPDSPSNPVPTYYWTLQDLKKAFKRWLDFAAASQRVCLFIDGLDEYEGDQEDIAQFFKDISDSSSPHIKICVSSRPWVVFDEAFNGLPGLRLQDLTFHDIQAYVSDKLQGHRYMKQLTERDPQQASELELEIVTKASGVFLWVRLVVISLLDGLRNRDDIEDLKARLRELPTDLSALYTHMLGRVQPFYKQQAARAFQIYHTISTVEQQEYRVTALELEMAITETWDNIQINNWRPMSETEIISKCDYLDVYLKRFDLCYSIPSKSTLKVNYLHRTVKDFLETGEVGDRLLYAKIPNFDPNLAVTMSYVTRLKRSVLLDHLGNMRLQGDNETWEAITRAMRYARGAEASGSTTYVDAIEELEQAGLYIWKNNFDPWLEGGRVPSLYEAPEDHWEKTREWRRNFLCRAISNGIFSYVEGRLQDDSSLITDKHGTPLLTYALPPKTDCSTDHCGRNMVVLLLRFGADPNERYAASTPWQELLTWIHGRYWNERSEFITFNNQHVMAESNGWPGWKQDPHFWAQMMRIMLSHGASSRTSCNLDHEVWRMPPLRSHPPPPPPDKFGKPKEKPTSLCKHCRRSILAESHCDRCDEPVKTDSHSVWDVINDVFDRWVSLDAYQLRRILQEREPRPKSLEDSVFSERNTTDKQKRLRFEDIDEQDKRKSGTWRC